MERTRGPGSVGTETLYAVIGAIAEGPDLERVLRAVVDLLVEATACHACFVYLRDGDLLRIRAASPVFEHVVGRVTLRMDEGLAGWVARNRTPAFIPEAAFDDPRMKYVPELEEERFQSMVAVPLVGRHGDVIGVVVLHTEAPREFEQDVLDFLVHVASLVVGAIDNAQLYDQTQRQVAVLSALTDLSQELASLTSRDKLYTTGCNGISRLVAADSCRLSLFDANGSAVDVAATPADAAGGGDALLHAPRGARLTAHLLDGGQAFGMVRVSREEPFTPDDARLLETSTHQLALALRTAELIERLAAENLVRQVFDALEADAPATATARARAAGWDPERPHVAVVAIPGRDSATLWTDRLGAEVEEGLRVVARNVLSDAAPDRLRALVPLGRDDTESFDRLRLELTSLGRALSTNFGMSRPRRSLANDSVGLAEAADAARVSRALEPNGGAHGFDDLGPYRFLVGLVGTAPPDRAHAEALQTLADYDARRRTSLLDTLESYLAARGAIRATAEQLVIHPNTLRQRLERIEALTGLELGNQDLLSLELSVKVHRLSGAA